MNTIFHHTIDCNKTYTLPSFLVLMLNFVKSYKHFKNDTIGPFVCEVTEVEKSKNKIYLTTAI